MQTKKAELKFKKIDICELLHSQFDCQAGEDINSHHRCSLNVCQKKEKKDEWTAADCLID